MKAPENILSFTRHLAAAALVILLVAGVPSASCAAETTSTAAAAPQPFYYIDATALGFSQKLTVASLQGLANKESPKLFVVDRPQDSFWLAQMERQLGVKSKKLTLEEALATICTNAPQVVFDPRHYWSLSIASTLAGLHEALLAEDPLNRPIAFDCRDRWTNKLEAYQWALTELLPKCRQDQLLYLDEVLPMMRDYGIQQKLFTLNLDPLNNPQDIKLLERILDRFSGQARVFGWATGAYAQNSRGQDGGTVENALVSRLSRHGMMLVPSDFSANLSFYARTRAYAGKLSQRHLNRELKFQAGKRYVLLVYSDGDNLQYDLAMLLDRFNDSRPKIPVAWTISPQLAEVAPTVLQSFYKLAAERGGWDEFIAGPSGCAYTFPGQMGAAQLDRFVQSTRETCTNADLTSVVILDDPGRPPATVEAFIKTYSEAGFAGLWLAAMPKYIGTARQTAYASERLRLLGRQNAADTAHRVKESRTTNPFFMIYVGAWETKGEDLQTFAENLDDRCVVVSATEMADLIRQWSAASSKIRQIEARPRASSGLEAMNSADGAFTMDDQGGSPCWRLPKHPTPTYLYFDADDAFRGPAIEIELEYLDTGTGDIVLQYDSTDARLPDSGAYKAYPLPARRTNKGQWQTARFRVNDARLGGRQNGGADFRFYNGGDDLLVRAVRVRRLAQ